MTQEQFIQKWGRWLPYTDRDKIKKEMNDDLDLLIEGQEQKIYICSPCNNCDGNGLIVGKSEMEECPICKGKGFIREQEKPAKEEREWKVGDMVRITKDESSHRFPIDSKVKVIRAAGKDNWQCFDGKSKKYLMTEEAELIEK